MFLLLFGHNYREDFLLVLFVLLGRLALDIAAALAVTNDLFAAVPATATAHTPSSLSRRRVLGGISSLSAPV